MKSHPHQVGSRRVGVCPITGKEVVQELIGISEGEEQWECLHNPHHDMDADAVDVVAFKKRHGSSEIS